MPARWTIQTVPHLRLLHMTLAGAFTLGDVARLDLDRKGAIGRLRCGFNEHLALIDVTRCDLSSPDVADAIRDAIANPVFRAKRCAMVVPNMLLKMQARRVVNRPDMAWCRSVDEAETWLLQPAGDRAA